MSEGNKDPLVVLELPTDTYVKLKVDEKMLKRQFRFVESGEYRGRELSKYNTLRYHD